MCNLDLPFRWSGRFKILRGKKHFTPAGQLRFPPGIFGKKDGRYRTKILGAEHNGVAYARCDENMSRAFTRITSSRKPEFPGLCDWLAANQQRTLGDPRYTFASHLAHMYESEFDDYLGFEEEALIHHADPHAKRPVRIYGWNELTIAGDQFAGCYVDVDTISFKYELAKMGKYPRAYCNLGIQSSLRGAWLLGQMKAAQSRNPVWIHEGVMEFVKTPNVPELRHAFQELINPSGRYYAAVFSDDSCLSIRHEGKVYRFNLDISGCDASHRPALFQRFRETFPPHLMCEVDALYEQCMKPCFLPSYADPKNYVLLLPLIPFLPSGSVLTTAMNTFAVFCAIEQIMCRPFSDGPVQATEIQNRAAEAGYYLTVEQCDDWHELQFLKHSPVYDVDGNIQPILNPGVIIRMFGSAHGDLPGHGPLEPRFREFLSQTLHGAVPYLNTPFFNIMKRIHPRKSFTNVVTARKIADVVADDLSYKVDHSQESRIIRVTTDELFARYKGLDALDVQVLLEEYATLDVGQFLANHALDVILQKDYGLATIHP
jgi:hypothetical protein